MANEIINLRRCAGGAAGTTAWPGATRARYTGDVKVKRASGGGAGLTGLSRKTGAAPRLIIEVEDFSLVEDAICGLLDNQTITLGYVGDSGNLKDTVKYCTCVRVGESKFPAMEEDGNVARMELEFALHAGAGVTTLAQAIVTTPDVGEPSGAAQNIVAITTAYRGVSGATEIGKTVSAFLRCTMRTKMSWAGGSELPSRVWATSREAQAVIETEDSSVWKAAITGAATDEILVLAYVSNTGNRLLTLQIARLAGVEDLPIEAAEQDGTVSRGRIVFDITLGTGVEGIADAIVDAAA